jgi:hypothetical protein
MQARAAEDTRVAPGHSARAAQACGHSGAGDRGARGLIGACLGFSLNFAALAPSSGRTATRCRRLPAQQVHQTRQRPSTHPTSTSGLREIRGDTGQLSLSLLLKITAYTDKETVNACARIQLCCATTRTNQTLGADASLRKFCAGERVATAELRALKGGPLAGCVMKRDASFEYGVVERHVAIEDGPAKSGLIGKASAIKARESLSMIRRDQVARGCQRSAQYLPACY